MREVARYMGWIFSFATAILLVLELGAVLQGEAISFRPLGQVWFNLHPASLNGLQAGIERHVWPPLWDPVMIFVITRPAALITTILALLFFVLAKGVVRKRD